MQNILSSVLAQSILREYEQKLDDIDEIKLLFVHHCTVQHRSMRFCDHKRFCRVLRPCPHLRALVIRQYFIADIDHSINLKMKEFQAK